MWASGHNGDKGSAAHGYEPTREAAMAAFPMREAHRPDAAKKGPAKHRQRGQVLRGVGYIHPRAGNLMALMITPPIWGEIGRTD
jgi:hypothetical protein